MNLQDLEGICKQVFGARGGDGSQEATGAVGHIKRYPINGDGRKILFLAKQGGSMSGPLWTSKLVSNTVLKLKLRNVDDCREKVTTSRKKIEWTGYHAEMIIVNRWFQLFFPKITKDDLKDRTFLVNIVQSFQKYAGSMIIAANAPCCKHCHYMLEHLGIEHPAPARRRGKLILKHSLTSWWNPLTDVRVSNGDTAFARNIPGLE